MGEFVKWGLLLLGLFLILGILLDNSILGIIDIDELNSSIAGIVGISSGYLKSARGAINYFFTPVGRTMLNVVIIYIIVRPFRIWIIKAISLAYYWIFK